VNRIVDVLQDVDIPHQPPPWLRLIGIAILFLVIGDLWPIWLRVAVKYCPCIKRVWQDQHSTLAFLVPKN
jgi:hypothetical protein